MVSLSYLSTLPSFFPVDGEDSRQVDELGPGPGLRHQRATRPRVTTLVNGIVHVLLLLLLLLLLLCIDQRGVDVVTGSVEPDLRVAVGDADAERGDRDEEEEDRRRPLVAEGREAAEEG